MCKHAKSSKWHHEMHSHPNCSGHCRVFYWPHQLPELQRHCIRRQRDTKCIVGQMAAVIASKQWRYDAASVQKAGDRQALALWNLSRSVQKLVFGVWKHCTAAYEEARVFPKHLHTKHERHDIQEQSRYKILYSELRKHRQMYHLDVYKASTFSVEESSADPFTIA